MFFRSELVSAHWDTWVYHDEKRFYAFYLISSASQWDAFGLAISDDGVRWIDHGPVLHASDKMVRFLGTGSVWKAVDRDGYICNYSEWRLNESGNPEQTILFATSKDLRHWTKCGDELIFPIDPRYYDNEGRWDCINPIQAKPGGGYYGTWTATPKGRASKEGGIGFGFTNDGLHWEALPPFELEQEADESGAIFQNNGRYYGLFGVFEKPMVMKTFQAERLEGPYRLSDRNPVALDRYAYFARAFEAGGTRLVNHHAISLFVNEHGKPLCYLAPLKTIRYAEDGTLFLAYWQGNERLKKIPIDPAFDHDVLWGKQVALMRNALGCEMGIVWECFVKPSGNQEIQGILIGMKTKGFTLLEIKADLSVAFHTLDKETFHVDPIYVFARDYPFVHPGHIRILAKESVLEVYVNDIYLCSYSMPELMSGQYGLLESDNFMDIRLWTP